MIQNFVKGIVVGGVVAGIGLGVISQLAPMPQTNAPQQVAEPIPAPAMPAPAAPAPAPASTAIAPATQPLPEAKTAQPSTPAPSPAPPAVVSLAPVVPVQPAPAVAAPQIALLTPPASVPSEPAALPKLSDTDQAPKADAAPAPLPVEDALLAPALTAPTPATPTPAAPVPAPASPKPTVPERLSPVAELPKTVDGVTLGRLPSIAAAPAAQTDAPDPAADMPLVKFARPFTNAAGKPLFAVVLKDSGAADLDRAALAALPFPISFVLNPMDSTASDAEKIYRAGGQEVVMLASGIPQGASPADLEQSFQINDAVLPQTVVVMDLETNGFQDDRSLSTQVVAVVKAMGRGLLTYDRGLNPADQVARREGLPSAMIFRELDAQNESAPLIRRYLDRAAFKAAQEGRVVVLGSTNLETITALMEWAVEGRGASVALAPISAVLSK
ncbi:divergent polysaccharide deacetylase family protein [Cypionkella sp.]|uniref:divergent polysaccharide deacetylase family protein n=1 Tax=Cypionkella sp. TaxID=2811411 RepID=UPI002FDCF231